MTRVLMAILVLLGASTAEAATYTTPTCAVADVAAAVAKATHGDTVAIPAGDCTWSTMLTVNVGITLKGAGEGVTIIRDNVPKIGGTASRLMTFAVNEPNRFRITGFTLVGVAQDPNVYNQGHIGLFGTSKAFRVDHLTVISPQTSLIRTFGWLYGVIDHITMTSSFKNLLQASHAGWGGSKYGDGSWADSLSLGTDKAIYVEDCVLTGTSAPVVTNFTDGLDGARLVIRNNVFVQGNTTSHGLDSGLRRRSIRSQEIYNNTFSFPAGMAAAFIAWFRGGTGVMFGNKVTGEWINHMAYAANQRDTQSFSPWGQCTGTSPYDLNLDGGYRCADQPGSGTSRHLNGVDVPPAQPVNNALDPIYVWGNTLNGRPNDVGQYGTTGTGHVRTGRDIFFGTPRPGYIPYQYPHPLTEAGSSAPSLSAPSGLQVK
jgi:hypothetical protein